MIRSDPCPEITDPDTDFFRFRPYYPDPQPLGAGEYIHRRKGGVEVEEGGRGVVGIHKKLK